MAFALKEVLAHERDLPAKLVERGLAGACSSVPCVVVAARLSSARGCAAGDGTDLQEFLGDRSEGRLDGLALLGPSGPSCSGRGSALARGCCPPGPYWAPIV